MQRSRKRSCRRTQPRTRCWLASLAGLLVLCGVAAGRGRRRRRGRGRRSGQGLLPVGRLVVPHCALPFGLDGGGVRGARSSSGPRQAASPRSQPSSLWWRRSFVLACLRLLRVLLVYLDEQMRSNPAFRDSWTVQLCMKCIHCLLWCFELSVKYLTRFSCERPRPSHPRSVASPVRGCGSSTLPRVALRPTYWRAQMFSWPSRACPFARRPS